MSKRSRKRAHEGAPRFVLLHHWIMRTAAWRALSPNGKAVLLEIWMRHNGSNNGHIVYAVREARQIGLSRSAAARALDECVDIGFLRVSKPSSFTAKTKEAREWVVTAESVDGRPATKEFASWQRPPETPTQSRQRDSQSRERDRGRRKTVQSSGTVPSAGLSPPDRTPDQSRSRDTSNLPGRPPRLEHGDEAKARRIARPAKAATPTPWYAQCITDEVEARLATAEPVAAAPAAPPDTRAGDGVTADRTQPAAAAASELLRNRAVRAALRGL